VRCLNDAPCPPFTSHGASLICRLGQVVGLCSAAARHEDGGRWARALGLYRQAIGAVEEEAAAAHHPPPPPHPPHPRHQPVGGAAALPPPGPRGTAYCCLGLRRPEALLRSLRLCAHAAQREGGRQARAVAAARPRLAWTRSEAHWRSSLRGGGLEEGEGEGQRGAACLARLLGPEEEEERAEGTDRAAVGDGRINIRGRRRRDQVAVALVPRLVGGGGGGGAGRGQQQQQQQQELEEDGAWQWRHRGKPAAAVAATRGGVLSTDISRLLSALNGAPGRTRARMTHTG
jgi:hypothetical protein